MFNANEAKLNKKGNVEEAYETLAQFLFEQYKKKKQSEKNHQGI